MKTKSALSYFGSDAGVANQLGKFFDDCRHVTIPFVGGASILPHLKARAIVANDKHRAALNFYRHMSNDETRGKLIDLCKHTLSHPGEIEDALEILSSVDATTYVHAWAFWAICWIGRKGKGGTKHQGGMPSVRRTANGGTNASRIRAAANDLDEWAVQFERCEWESVDFRDLLPKVVDRAACGVYCDPPWIDSGRNYLHNFTGADHSELECLLRSFKRATVVVRYGASATIRDLYSGSNWRIIEQTSRDQCNNVKGEFWITNGSGFLSRNDARAIVAGNV